MANSTEDKKQDEKSFLIPNDPFKARSAVPPVVKKGIPMPKIKPKKEKTEKNPPRDTRQSITAPPTKAYNNSTPSSASPTTNVNNYTETVDSSTPTSSTSTAAAVYSNTAPVNASPVSSSTSSTNTRYDTPSSAVSSTSINTSPSSRFQQSSITSSTSYVHASTSSSSATTSSSNTRFGTSLETSSSPNYSSNVASSRLGTTTTSSSSSLSSTTSSSSSTTSSSSSATSSSSSAQDKKEIPVKDSEFLLLRDFIYEASGIYIANNRKYLIENRLSARVRALGLSNFSEYHSYLKNKDSSKTELNKLYENITTNETFFFRNIPQLDSVRDVVFRQLIKLNAKSKKLRIWSAGCSSGEEPYTIAIMLAELLGSEFSKWDIRITANDLSPAILKVAQQAEYNDYTLRSTPPEYLPRYFTKEGPLYKIKPELKKIIKFGQINLNDSNQTKQVERSDVIFCRNVIIYFDDDVKRNVINAFSNNLLDHGFLVVGHSESLHSLTKDFVGHNHPGTIIYTK